MKQYARRLVEKILRWMASLVLNTRKPEIIAITGSAGKSSTKEAIYTVLSKSRDYKGRVGKNYGNLNEEIGVPLSILGFTKPIRWFIWPFALIFVFFKIICYMLHVIGYPQILVLELSANKLGDIKYLTSFIKPHIAVITAIGPSHMEFFKSINNIVLEKGRLIEVLRKNDYALLNEDDKLVSGMAKRTDGQVVYFHGGQINSEREPAKIIGRIYGLNDNEIAEILRTFTPLAHRLNTLRGIKDTTVIDDTYNANPLSMMRALNFLNSKIITSNQSRKIAVLGDMLELGEESVKYHKEIAIKARAVADKLFLVGSEFSAFSADKHFNNSKDAAEYLLKEIRSGDIILIKGSRGMKMERITEALWNK